MCTESVHERMVACSPTCTLHTQTTLQGSPSSDYAINSSRQAICNTLGNLHKGTVASQSCKCTVHHLAHVCIITASNAQPLQPLQAFTLRIMPILPMLSP